MGNAASDVTSGVKKQAEADNSSLKLYQLLDMQGRGILVDLTKQAQVTRNYAALDEAIKTRVEPLLYNNGKGKLVHISELVLMRNRERSKHKHIFKNEADFDNYQPPTDCKDPTMYREVCWDIKERGAVGETCLHICLLHATSTFSELFRRLIQFYPKLINDIYISDEYYGENVLHMAIVNEDPAMVKFMLDSGASITERCSGAFMSPEDQKPTRTDSLDQEPAVCDQNTNYQGYVYFGEYPACFAACLGQEECYRLILAKGADPNAQDSYGNTVLHMLVIHDKKHMFSTAYELGADMHYANKLNLTPLTLAAKMARKELFFHILNISREIYWQIGSVTCAAYPLSEFDTIDPENGGIRKESALNLIVFGESTMHLELLEGPVEDLLQIKWSSFIKARFYRQFILFLIFFLISTSAFVLRPIHKMGTPLQRPTAHNKTANATTLAANQTFLNNSNNPNVSVLHLLVVAENATSLGMDDDDNFTMNGTSFLEWINRTDEEFNLTLAAAANKNSTNSGSKSEFCFDKIETPSEITLAVLEGLMLLGTAAYLLGALRECHFLGVSMFFENLATVPSRVLFLFSRILVLLMAALRLLCWKEVEDLVAVFVMLSTAPYFLFFCRGFKTVGPFVVMIYRMITGDLLRFVLIYLVFVMGFSQAFFIIFLSFNKPDTPNPMRSPAESVIAMFLMSLSSFDATFDAFQHTDHEAIANLMFVVYMAIVAILLINMLIAMMGNTYTKIAETRNEWQRQWARIVLVVERGVSPVERHSRQRLYSQPMADGSLALVLRLNQTEDEKEEMKELMDIRKYHDKAIQKRLAKLMEANNIVPRRSIVNTLHQQQQHHQHQHHRDSTISVTLPGLT